MRVFVLVSGRGEPCRDGPYLGIGIGVAAVDFVVDVHGGCWLMLDLLRDVLPVRALRCAQIQVAGRGCRATLALLAQADVDGGRVHHCGSGHCDRIEVRMVL